MKTGLATDQFISWFNIYCNLIILHYIYHTVIFSDFQGLHYIGKSELWFCGSTKCVLASCPAVCVCVLFRWIKKKQEKFFARVQTKRKAWYVKAMWRVCAEKQNWLFDYLTGFLRESFCQPGFPSWSAVEVFFSLSCLHLASWTAPPPFSCHVACHIASLLLPHTQTHTLCFSVFVKISFFTLTLTLWQEIIIFLSYIVCVNGIGTSKSLSADVKFIMRKSLLWKYL